VPTFKVSVNVVNVLASVRNRNGDIIKNLGKNDFIIEEDGRPQTIKYFTQQTDLPLTTGLLVDVSGSQRRLIDEERDASRVFFNQLLRPEQDTAFVLHFARDVELLQDLTSSRRKLQAALNDLDMRDEDAGRIGWPRRGGGYPGGGGGGGGRAAGGTSLYDAVYLAANDIMQRQEGRKAVIILSDGVDTTSKISIDDAVEAAQRADMIVYSILFYDDAAYGRSAIGFPGGRRGRITFPMPNMGQGDGKRVLQRLARETGGSFFEVSRSHSINDIYANIHEELRNQYNLGYTPDRAYDGHYRKIRVMAREKGLKVQARDGYYAVKK